MSDVLYRRKLGCRLRKIGKDFILLSDQKAYKLNYTGYNIWVQLEKEKNIEVLSKNLGHEFDVNLEKVYKDVEEYLDFLEYIGAVTKIES